MPRRRTDTGAHRRASPLAVLVFIAMLVALAAWLLPSRALQPSANLRFTLLDGGTTSLAALRGRPVLVAFWATTCVPCIEEVPDLVRLYREFHPRGLELIAVTMPYDPPLQVQRFVEERSVPYRVALDLSGAVSRAFGGVEFIPTSFLLDADGNVLFRRTGKLDVRRTRQLLERSALKPIRSPAPKS